MNIEPFTRGDVVKLKSGGPDMVVTYPQTYDDRSLLEKIALVMPGKGFFGVGVQWMDTNGNHQQTEIPQDLLITSVK